MDSAVESPETYIDSLGRVRTRKPHGRTVSDARRGLILDALRAGEPPGDIASRYNYTLKTVMGVARKAGIAPPKMKPRGPLPGRSEGAAGDPDDCYPSSPTKASLVCYVGDCPNTATRTRIDDRRRHPEYLPTCLDHLDAPLPPIPGAPDYGWLVERVAGSPDEITLRDLDEHGRRLALEALADRVLTRHLGRLRLASGPPPVERVKSLWGPAPKAASKVQRPRSQATVNSESEPESPATARPKRRAPLLINKPVVKVEPVDLDDEPVDLDDDEIEPGDEPGDGDLDDEDLDLDDEDPSWVADPERFEDEREARRDADYEAALTTDDDDVTEAAAEPQDLAPDNELETGLGIRADELQGTDPPERTGEVPAAERVNPTETEEAMPPARTPRPRVTDEEILDVLRRSPGLNTSQIARENGRSNPSGTGMALRRLMAAGRVVPVGARRGRKAGYRLTDQPIEPERPRRGARVGSITDDEILQGLAAFPAGIGPKELAERLGRHPGPIGLHCRRLTAEGRIERTGASGGPLVRYRLLAAASASASAPAPVPSTSSAPAPAVSPTVSPASSAEGSGAPLSSAPSPAADSGAPRLHGWLGTARGALVEALHEVDREIAALADRRERIETAIAALDAS